LKPITGAATALVAVLLLQSNLLLGPIEQNQSMFLAYAVLFGFSQQLLTQFVDKRAVSLITPDAATTGT
jgi:peptidoglycan biosynthesis protein MviN/MurJ (putative lipid II flippase)